MQIIAFITSRTSIEDLVWFIRGINFQGKCKCMEIYLSSSNSREMDKTCLVKIPHFLSCIWFTRFTPMFTNSLQFESHLNAFNNTTVSKLNPNVHLNTTNNKQFIFNKRAYNGNFDKQCLSVGTSEMTS